MSGLERVLMEGVELSIKQLEKRLNEKLDVVNKRLEKIEKEFFIFDDKCPFLWVILNFKYEIESMKDYLEQVEKGNNVKEWLSKRNSDRRKDFIKDVESVPIKEEKESVDGLARRLRSMFGIMTTSDWRGGHCPFGRISLNDNENPSYIEIDIEKDYTRSDSAAISTLVTFMHDRSAKPTDFKVNRVSREIVRKAKEDFIAERLLLKQRLENALRL